MNSLYLYIEECSAPALRFYISTVSIVVNATLVALNLGVPNLIPGQNRHKLGCLYQ